MRGKPERISADPHQSLSQSCDLCSRTVGMFTTTLTTSAVLLETIRYAKRRY